MLLSSYGLEAETTTEYEDTIVDIPQSLGSTSSEDLAINYSGPFWSGDTNRYHIFKNWGSGSTLFTNNLPTPTVTNGAAAVTLFNVSNSTSYNNDFSLTENLLTLGDPIVFAGEESTGFQINAFPNTPSKLLFKEGATIDNNYQLTFPPIPNGFRNFITVSSSQAQDFNASSDFQVFLRIKKYSQEPGDGNSLSSNVINTRIVVVGSVPFSSFDVPNNGGKAHFNFNPYPHIPNSAAQETDISALYSDQHGVNLFLAEGGDSCVAIGVEFGIMITNVSSGTSRFLAQNVENYGTFGIAYLNAAIVQNHQLILVPHP